MKVFVTGATGFIGSAVVGELLNAGHEVTGLARSDASAHALTARGVRVYRGDLNDPDALRTGAARCEAAIHLAFFHQFSHASLGTRLRALFGGAPSGIVMRFMDAALDADRRTIEVLADALRGSDRALVTTFGTLGLPHGTIASEESEPDMQTMGAMRSRTERAVRALAQHGLRTAIVRLPPIVHDDGDRHGFAPRIFGAAKKHGFSAYIGDGSNRWPSVHRADVARLYRLVLENGKPGERYHAVADEGIPFRTIAETVGRVAKVPALSKPASEANKLFSFIGPFVPADNPASSTLTRERLGWTPSGPSLLEDIGRAAYFA